MLSLFFFEAGFGQLPDVSASDIKIHFGETVETTDCQEVRIPVWFEYTGNDTGIDHFSFCYRFPTQDELNSGILKYDNIILEGQIENGIILDIVDLTGVSNLWDLDGDLQGGGMFRLSTLASSNNQLVSINFTDELNPSFEIIVDIAPLQDFQLIEVKHKTGIYLSDNCTDGYPNSRPHITGPNVLQEVDFTIDNGNGSTTEYYEYTMDFEGENTTLTDCSYFESAELSYYIDVDVNNIIYSGNDNGNSSTYQAFVPVRMSANNPAAVINFQHIDFDITWMDEFDNLNLGSPLTVNNPPVVYSDLDNSSFTFTTDNSNNNLHVKILPTGNSGSIQIPFPGDDPILFTLVINLPNEPLEGGEATFNFENSTVQFDPDADGHLACCYIPSDADQVLSLNQYTYPCPDNSPLGLEVSSSVNEDPCEMPFIPVILRGSTVIVENNNSRPISITIKGIELEMELTFMGTVQIDVIETTTSINNSNLFIIDVLDENTIKLHTIPTLNIVPDFAQNEELALFDIVLMGEGNVSEFWLKQDELTYDVNYTDGGSPAFAAFNCIDARASEANGTTGDIDVPICTGFFGQVETIYEIDGQHLAIEGVEICVSVVTANEDPCEAATCIETATTDADGFSADYCNADNSMRHSFTASKDDEGDCGLTTLDFLQIHKYILGRPSLVNENWLIFAADVNGDGDVTTFDLILLRKAILQTLALELPWKFVSCDYEWDLFDPENATTHPSSCIEITENTQDPCNVCFNAIKTGDIDRSCVQGINMEKPNDILYLELIDKGINNDGKYEVGFMPLNFEYIIGYQMALEADAQKMSYDNWKAEDLLYVKGDNFEALDGITRILWTDDTFFGKTLTGSNEIFGQTYTTLLPFGMSTADISLRNDIVPARAYSYDGKIYEIQLVKNTGGGGGIQFLGSSDDYTFESDMTVYKGNQDVIVKFSSETEEKGKLRIFDLQGRILYQTDIEAQKGTNVFEINTNNWPNAMYIMNLQLSQRQYTKKWVKN